MKKRNFFDGLENHEYYYLASEKSELILSGTHASAWGIASSVDEFLNKLIIPIAYTPYTYKLKTVVCANEFTGNKVLFYMAYFEKQEN